MKRTIRSRLRRHHCLWGIVAATTFSTSHIRLQAVQPGLALARNQRAQSVLDSKRLNALGLIETGNDDRAVGKAGEISRYQLAPKVWNAYSSANDYQNPNAALKVAQKHWTMLAVYFQLKSGHAPTDFDMYVLWNTRHGYYERRAFVKSRISPVVRERAERFVNLVNKF